MLTVLYLIHYNSLLQTATDIITKCDSFITKCDSYYELQPFYYNMRQLLQNARFITKCDITSHLICLTYMMLKQLLFAVLEIVVYFHVYS